MLPEPLSLIFFIQNQTNEIIFLSHIQMDLKCKRHTFVGFFGVCGEGL